VSNEKNMFWKWKWWARVAQTSTACLSLIIFLCSCNLLQLINGKTSQKKRPTSDAFLSQHGNWDL